MGVRDTLRATGFIERPTQKDGWSCLQLNGVRGQSIYALPSDRAFAIRPKALSLGRLPNSQAILDYMERHQHDTRIIPSNDAYGLIAWEEYLQVVLDLMHEGEG